MPEVEAERGRGPAGRLDDGVDVRVHEGVLQFAFSRGSVRGPRRGAPEMSLCYNASFGEPGEALLAQDVDARGRAAVGLGMGQVLASEVAVLLEPVGAAVDGEVRQAGDRREHGGGGVAILRDRGKDEGVGRHEAVGRECLPPPLSLVFGSAASVHNRGVLMSAPPDHPPARAIIFTPNVHQRSALPLLRAPKCSAHLIRPRHDMRNARSAEWRMVGAWSGGGVVFPFIKDKTAKLRSRPTWGQSSRRRRRRDTALSKRISVDDR